MTKSTHTSMTFSLNIYAALAKFIILKNFALVKIEKIKKAPDRKRYLLLVSRISQKHMSAVR